MDGRRLKLKLAIALGFTIALAVQAEAAECPREGTLGTSRIMAVDAATTPRVGRSSFPKTLDLQDREIVLTFDDGPVPATDEKVLAALAEQCVQATFFLIGKPASENPEWVRRIAAAGHTVGHHSWSHNNMRMMSPEDAIGEIDKGIAAVEMALNGVATTTPSTPFFRYPFFEMSQASLDYLGRRGIVVFGADLSANDWLKMPAEEQLKRMIDSVNKAGKGILLLHSSEEQTAAALPAFLRYLRDNRYRVVHVVPAVPARPVADVNQK
jgi:peptidoglycan/xylan/chitin deacetylase (PgdA/CDA1 family)